MKLALVTTTLSSAQNGVLGVEKGLTTLPAMDNFSVCIPSTIIIIFIIIIKFSFLNY
jgi:hypothetical protein